MSSTPGDPEPDHVSEYLSEDHPTSRSVQMVAFDPRWLRRTLLVVFAAIIGWQLIEWTWSALGRFLFLILLAWLLAISFEPLVGFLTRHRMRRGSATGVVMVFMLLTVVAFFGIFGSLLATQAADLITDLPNLVANVVAWINSTFDAALDPTTIQESLQITPERIAEYAGTVAGGLLGVIGGLFDLIFSALTVIVFAFYLSADSPRIKRTIASWLPQNRQLVFVNVWEIAVDKAGGFVVSKLVLSVISAFAHSILFWILDIPFWLPMGIFAGVVGQFIPTIGTYIGIIVPCLFAAFDDPLDVVWIIGFATIYQQVENYVLTPRVSKRTMDVHAGIALAAVFIGAAIFGPIGAIIGIPLVAMVIAVIEAYGQRYDIHPDLIQRGEAVGLEVTPEEAEAAERNEDDD